MGTTLEAALFLAKKHFHVFPLPFNKKKPPTMPDYFDFATTNEKNIRRFWVDPVLDIVQPYNVGISTTSFNGGEEALLAVDVDTKDGKKGDETLLQLELEGFDFPVTYTQRTPSGGYHLVYRVKSPVRQFVGKNEESPLGRGLDVRSFHGYIVGAGSMINGVPYTGDNSPIAKAPKWLIERCGAPKEKILVQVPGLLDEERAKKRAIHYLENEAPLAIKGAGGDQTTYLVAASLKDFGVGSKAALELMLDHWNDRCPPGWTPDRLAEKIDHAYKYGNEAMGALAPEAQFEPVLSSVETTKVEPQKCHPFVEMNREYAFVLAGSSHHIIWETKDAAGQFDLRHIKEESFHATLAAEMFNGKQLTKEWIKSKIRRSYDGFCFRPELKTSDRYCNLWRGFSVTPLPKDEKPSEIAQKALDDWLDHILINVCNGEKEQARWLVGFFAHLVQKPWEKPHVSIIMRGLKGVGKNAVMDRIGYLLGPHYMETANKEDMVGRFNGHFENKLFFCLSEAFWSGDRKAEGVLKHLITGTSHNVEHKGQEKFRVDNLARIAVVGNADWIVPVSPDDRRYATFNVGDGRKEDHKFFKSIQDGMEKNGGYELLLRYLLEFDISELNFNLAPRTKGLLDQKHASLDPFHQWWLDCLKDGTLVGSDSTSGWPSDIEKQRFREAFHRYVKTHQISSRIPSDRIIGKNLKKCFSSIISTTKRLELDKTAKCNIYRFPDLKAAREDWSKFIGHPVEWDEEGENE